MPFDSIFAPALERMKTSTRQDYTFVREEAARLKAANEDAAAAAQGGLEMEVNMAAVEPHE